MVTTLISLVASLTIHQAHAVAARASRPMVPEIKARAVDVIYKVQKSYDCTLIGQPENGWSWSEGVAVPPVTAMSLEGAAELAITPFVRPRTTDSTVKVLVDGVVYLIESVKCKPTEREI